jgi:hypothetical protein
LFIIDHISGIELHEDVFHLLRMEFVSEGSEMKIFSKTKRAAQVQPLSRMSSAGRGDHFFSGVFEQFHLLLQIVHGNIPNIILHKNLKLQNEDGKHYL